MNACVFAYLRINIFKTKTKSYQGDSCLDFAEVGNTAQRRLTL